MFLIYQVGDNTRLNGAGLMAACGITIGRDCIPGSAVIVDTDFHSIDLDHRTNPDANIRTLATVPGWQVRQLF